MSKKLIITSATVLFIGLTAFTQDFTNSKNWQLNENNTKADFPRDLFFEVRGKYSRPVKKEKLEEAKSLSDFIDGYPSNWIDEHVSVEILATCSGKAMSAISVNDKLNSANKYFENS